MKVARDTKLAPDNILIKREIVSGYICIPIDFYFAFFCCPFRLIRSKSEKSGKSCYSAQKFYLHMFFCVVLSFSDILWMIAFIRNSIPDKNSNPALFLELLKTVLSQTYKLLLMKKFWFEAQDFLNLVNFLESANGSGGLILSHLKPKWHKITIWALCILFTGLGLWSAADVTPLGPINTNNMSINGSFKGWELWWANMVDGSRKIFFIDGFSEEGKYSDGLRTKRYLAYHSLDVALGVVAGAGRLHRLLLIFPEVLNF